MTEDQTDSGAGVQRLGAEELDAWLEGAQPGAQIVYFSGVFAGDGSPALNDRLMAEAERGMLYLVQRRRRIHGFDYIAVRSTRPVHAGATRAPRPITLQDEVEAAFAAGGRGR